GVAFAASPASTAMSLGARLKSSDGLLVVDAVTRGGAAMEAGLLPNDELLAIGGLRTTSEAAVKNALRGVREGQATEVLVARAGVVKQLTLRGRRDARQTIRLTAGPANEVRRTWLKREG
ncbi:MAG TPA: PDZ domain-containing protein, partial [Thermoanaerobaculia bacterium]